MARSCRVVLALALTVAACSSSPDGSTNTTATVPTTTAPTTTTTEPTRTTTTTEPTTTTDASTTTTETTTTSTVADTTTTVPASVAPLRRDGFSSVPFGTEAEGAIVAVATDLGPPTDDTGWVDPLSISTCAGTQARRVTWGNLALLFGDESTFVQGAPHLLGWSYGDVEEVGGEPVGLITAEDIGLGDTLAELRAAYPTVTVSAGEEGLVETTFYVDDALSGLLTGATDGDTVIVIAGGPYCG